VEGLAGGSCLFHLWRAAGSVQSPASQPHNHQVEGIHQVSFPCQGRYSTVTRPVTLEDDGDRGGVDGAEAVSSGRCSSGSGAVWVFCLASGGLLGVLWTPFERKVFSSGVPRVFPWPPLGARVPLAPVGGRGRSPLFPFPGLIPFQRKCHLSFPPPSAGSRLLVFFAESVHPSLKRRCQFRSQGVLRGGP
jgi:hypothetical protein